LVRPRVRDHGDEVDVAVENDEHCVRIRHDALARRRHRCARGLWNPMAA
jgi:hypothetical protein